MNRILGMGAAVPDNVVTNDDLSERMETSDEWIQQRTGIRERRHVTESIGAADLGATAARRALDAAGVGVDEIDTIIFPTLSPDIDWPGSACLLAERLGLSGVRALDVRNQCSGFIYSLASADALISAGRSQRALVVGGEIHSTGLDLTTRGREVGVIFGDGASAAVVGPSESPERGILSSHLHADGKYAEKLWLPAPASRNFPRLSEADFEGDSPPIFPRMAGRYVFKHAVTRFPEVIKESLEANGYGLSELDALIPHQANLRINQFVADALELPAEKVVNNIDRYGNTTAASIPLALTEAIEDGRVKEGSLVCLAAFGAGFTWAASLLRW